MHKLEMYEGLRDIIEKEVTEIQKRGSLDEKSLDHLYKLMMSLKCTDRAIEREEGGNSMMSRMSYDSYGMSNARRGRDGDGDGRYNESRDNFRGYSNRRGSYDSYESSGTEEMMMKLEAMMQDAKSEKEREAIRDCMRKLNM